MLSMEDVYREHSHMVYQYLLSLSHDADLAEELTQETFYQIISMQKARCLHGFVALLKIYFMPI